VVYSIQKSNYIGQKGSYCNFNLRYYYGNIEVAS
jgi:hypothetical protein